MIESILGELDTRLSAVQRWVVVNTIKKQSVAEHCFNVERIARRIAVQWFKLKPSLQLDELSQIALHHDDGEAITGDLPSPAKSVLSEKYLDEQSRLWYNQPSLVHDIVKLADKMEAYWFLTMESELGNRYISQYRAEIYGKVIAAAFAMGSEIETNARIWMHQIDRIIGTTYDPTTGSPTGSPESREG